MAVAKMSSKGQVTMPKEVRESLHLEAGDKVLFVVLPGKRAAIVPRNRDIRDLAGILHDPDRPGASIDEINEGIARGAAESGARGIAQ